MTQEVEAEASGVLLKIAVASGEVPVGQTVAVIGEAGETVELGAPPAAAPAPVPAAEPAHEEPEPPPAPSNGAAAGGRIKASPLARRMARERGLELASIAGTGPDGRIVAEDVERAGAAPAPAIAPPPPLRSRRRARSSRSR